MKYFYEVFENIPRQGPGANKYTKKAYDMIKGYLPEHPKIIDIGSGKGAPSFKLAEICNGHVTCYDNHQPFVDYINKKAADEYIEDIIEAKLGDMNNLDLPEGRFDVLWAEGSLYIIGFEKGLLELQKYVKDMGYMVVSEAVWIKENPPEELMNFWNEEYQAIDTIENKMAVIEKCNLRIIAHFTLPEDGWTLNYYDLIDKKLTELKEINQSNKEALDSYALISHEFEIYKKYKEYYSYEYFILKKI